PAGGAGVVPHRDLRLDRERGPFEIRVAPAGVHHLTPFAEDRGERREIPWRRIRRERAPHDADPRVSRPGAREAAPARDARAPLLPTAPAPWPGTPAGVITAAAVGTGARAAGASRGPAAASSGRSSRPPSGPVRRASSARCQSTCSRTPSKPTTSTPPGAGEPVVTPAPADAAPSRSSIAFGMRSLPATALTAAPASLSRSNRTHRSSS